ncbi:SHOCT domain-containing protein [Agrococcus sp. ProA11]|uniref:SHOCT domain-containing protein n=1 Tax=Agrococcus chionoecetis TaxID=3153752 RepID=UPI003260EE08
MFDGHWMGMHWGWVWVVVVISLIVIGALVALVLRATGTMDRRRSVGVDPEIGLRARAILDERYARGEIDSADYQERVERLRRER